MTNNSQKFNTINLSPSGSPRLGIPLSIVGFPTLEKVLYTTVRTRACASNPQADTIFDLTNCSLETSSIAYQSIEGFNNCPFCNRSIYVENSSRLYDDITMKFVNDNDIWVIPIEDIRLSEKLVFVGYLLHDELPAVDAAYSLSNAVHIELNDYRNRLKEALPPTVWREDHFGLYNFIYYPR